MKLKKGFTLIELLIVVAIIAILAAIAIPNFLEAQVRAKVSRAKADMRSIATALESYAVDQNKYPPDCVWGATLYDTYYNRLCMLTSPVAYITTVFPDPFQSQIMDTVPPIWNGYYRYWEKIGYDAQFGLGAFCAGDVIPSNNNAVVGPSYVSAKWALKSYGPDREQNWDGVVSGHVAYHYQEYDSTNGTVSYGDIIRVGP